ncbi:furin isoform X2 [Engystomops pustulosus]|uniref:furin isoform X2 n=1 Tax=Engystomops pustulosus TaxID=76066 RepID=UPI003AFB0C76
MDLRPTVFFLFWTSLSLQLKDLTGHKVYTNTWAVHVPGGPAVADRISKKYGFINHGQIFGDYYHFHHRAVVKRSLSPHRTRHVQLSRDPQVHWVEQQVAKKRRKRDIFTEPTDPKFPLQWYLYDVNRHDLHVKEAWAQGYTGKGVVVSILDDGIEKNHPDLQENYDPAASYDVNDQDPDPQPRYTQLNDNRHGTRCAGEVAAVANNGICGVGIAYNAKIGGVRMLDGEVTDAVEARSLGLNPNHIHIYSASWGPEDDGKTVDGPAHLAEEAFFRGVKQVTTDLRQKCTDTHTGTSASAPLAAGIIALALEANNNLTWRDMQHLVVRTSNPAHLNTNDWITNGVGRKVSHSYGYGLLDAGAMVALAKNWTSVGPQRKCMINILTEPKDIGRKLEVRRKVEPCNGMSNYISMVEHVQTRLTLSYNRRGDLGIYLTSPMGTRSCLLAPRPHDYSADGFNDWAFMTTHSWDEDPAGEWILEIENASGNNNYGTLTQFMLVLYGTASDPPSVSNQVDGGGCRTVASGQSCVVCEEGFLLHQKTCVKTCPPAFTASVQSIQYTLENNIEPLLANVCVACHPSCSTCKGTSANDCLSCPAHSHYNDLDFTCSHQVQISRESPPLKEAIEEAAAVTSNLPIIVASLSCVMIVVVFVSVFLFLQVRSGVILGKKKLYMLDSGIISYKGIPSDVWKEEGFSESETEEFDPRNERTAFIKQQSAL